MKAEYESVKKFFFGSQKSLVENKPEEENLFSEFQEDMRSVDEESLVPFPPIDFIKGDILEVYYRVRLLSKLFASTF